MNTQEDEELQARDYVIEPLKLGAKAGVQMTGQSCNVIMVRWSSSLHPCSSLFLSDLSDANAAVRGD
jgi:hypothetical protein